MSPVWTNPDGSRIWVPDAEPSQGSRRLPTPRDVRQFLREIGKRGGQERARRHSKADLSYWASLGGRAKAAKAKNGALSPRRDSCLAGKHGR
jgi:hypothetical protein